MAYAGPREQPEPLFNIKVSITTQQSSSQVWQKLRSHHFIFLEAWIIQYITSSIHKMSSCCVLLCLYHLCMMYLSIFFRVVSQALGQLYNLPQWLWNNPERYGYIWCSGLMYLYYHIIVFFMVFWSICFSVALLVQGQLYDCPSDNEVTLKDMGKFYLGLYPLNGKTSCCQISWNVKAVRLDLIMIISIWNFTGILAVLLPRNSFQISEQLKMS